MASTQADKITPFHVKIYTGMGRFRLLPAEALDFARHVRRLSGLRLEGAFTHFAVADSADKTYTRQRTVRSIPFCDCCHSRKNVV